ncbi:TPA: hypothetical protein ACUNF5_000881 [Burkholderia orbicola]|uniref:hypothetical protein n=1 Tax=Burkholderia cenocepacia TaxID=95486 RepID=UPI000F587346|nr:hypothetical protein [Burkholderia cenocepacia]
MMLGDRFQTNYGVAMDRKYKWLGIGLVLLAVGHYLQLRGLQMSAQHRDHATEQGQARLQSRVGRTYWVSPAANSTYQFVRFGNENTADSIAHGIAAKNAERFTVIQLSTKPDSDDGTYQVRFADGTLKWLDNTMFNIHQYAPSGEMKRPFEIFEEDPRILDTRGQDKGAADKSSLLGPDPTKPSHVFFGMTEQQALASEWGKPVTVFHAQSPRGLIDGWIYGRGNFLTFANGHLEEVLNSL